MAPPPPPPRPPPPLPHSAPASSNKPKVKPPPPPPLSRLPPPPPPMKRPIAAGGRGNEPPVKKVSLRPPPPPRPAAPPPARPGQQQQQQTNNKPPSAATNRPGIPAPVPPPPPVVSSTVLSAPTLVGATDMATKYEMLEQIGSGTYGYVFRARVRGTDKVVALKRIKMDDPRPETHRDGFPITALREIKLLSCISHENVVRLEEIATSTSSSASSSSSSSFHGEEKDLGPISHVPSSIYMVFEYCEADLLDVLKAARNHTLYLTQGHLHSFTRQLLEGMFYIHKNRILHRDIKAANILVTRDCRLKIGDWGLARTWHPPPHPAPTVAEDHGGMRSASEREKTSRYTDNVVTLWYRAPELLMGVASYTTAIDIWSIGCLIAELFLLRTLLQGRDELEQLNLIFNLCGTPSPETWPVLRQGQAQAPPTRPTCPPPSYPPHPSYRPRIVKQQLSCTPGGKEGADLVDKLLALNPNSRWSAEQALDHEYLWMEDPKEPGELPPIMHLRRAQTSAGGKG